jgi:hypothetical protein
MALPRLKTKMRAAAATYENQFRWYGIACGLKGKSSKFQFACEQEQQHDAILPELVRLGACLDLMLCQILRKAGDVWEQNGDFEVRCC